MSNTTIPFPPDVSDLGHFDSRMRRNIRAAVEDWDEVCSSLGAWEAVHLASGDSESAKEQHHIWVTKLISWGQLIDRLTKDSELLDESVVNRIHSRLRHLQDKLAIWHGEMSPEEEERILRSAFA